MRLRSIVLVFLCSCSSLLAQKPLSIGDTVPDVLFENLVNHSSTAARLSDFKGKLVILDFWATWCTSCLHAFPKLDSLQAVFEQEMKVLLINTKSTGDNLSKVQTFFARYKTRKGKGLGLVTVVNDTITDKLFPHQLLPHYVWIAKSGRVIATTSSEAVTAKAIRDVLDGVPPSFIIKKDQDIDRPLFSSADLPTVGLLNYAVLVKGWNEGLPSGNKIRRKDSVIYGRAFSNMSLLDMYKIVANGVDPTIIDRHIVVEPEDSSSLVAPPSGTERDIWYMENAYNLDVIVPQSEATNLFPRMLDVLNLNSGYTGRFEERKIKCWVLTKKSPAIRLKSKGGRTQNKLRAKNKPLLTNGNISVLVNFLTNLPAINRIVLDETGHRGNVDLQMDKGFTDLTSIHDNLASQGLLLTLTERPVKLFVIRKKPAL